MTKLISVIVTTYNWPSALAACINSLLAQSDRHFEIIIADDGSGADTRQLIAELSTDSPLSIRSVYHPDQGFRAATIRNKAVAESRGSYLIFLDGDCVVFPHFIQRHRRLAESAHFVPGNRLLISEQYTNQALQQQIPLHLQNTLFFMRCKLSGQINRILPLLYLPFSKPRYLRPKYWQQAMTCNLGVWKQDFIAVNGFDELFQGWGYEDSDLVIRLIHQGIKRKEGRFAVPVLHLWHPQNDRSRHDPNYARLLQRLTDKTCIRSEAGIDQYLQI
ncbi:glycosyltransferase family 2 protein [Methylomonas paludis]|uniref:Glycosyltransferase family 2 protein n=1 Tax=Methylomonas paludis TaxID=1173101 RepID=A0A975R8P9_9GAMM|nr:glycosyltransferase family 2 protein [Methylomonas paludis]QWF70247.1 glycosyltransferase family 2 protein [Methylomonas paludis]